MPNRNAEFQTLYDTAMSAGRQAATLSRPVPMIVGTETALFSGVMDYSKPVEVVSDGVCGFAWINIKPATSAFAKWLKAKGYARPDSYYGGVTIWISDYNQSMTRKEAHAGAMAKVLFQAGYKAHSNSRMD